MQDRTLKINEKPMLHLKDVVFRYYENGKRNILDHVSLDIEEGNITVIMGNSGCGKSTMAAVLAGLYPENGGYLEGGEIELYGHPVQDMTPQQRAAYLTLMFQNPDLQFCMNTLRKELIFCMENIQVPVEQMDAKIQKTAEVLHLTELLDRELSSLSGGEKQKASLACMYIMESRCIILDEAFANIDAHSVKEILPLLTTIKEQGRSIVAIDHQPEYWKALADEFILLGEGGKVMKRGTAEDCKEIFVKPYHDFSLPAVETEEACIMFQNVSVPKGEKRKRFQKKQPTSDLLTDTSVTFKKGAMTAIVGPSGSGKTTTFLSLLKQHPYEGRITIEGSDIKKLREKELFQKIGIVFQNPTNQFISQNVLEEVMSSIQIWHPSMTKEACRNLADEMLESYGLKRYYKYSPFMLSQGQQRRLAVLSVLAGGQKILLLDEPTYGQDNSSTMAIMEQVQKKVREEGLTVIFITHDIALAQSCANEIYSLEHKQLIKKTPEELEA